MLITIAAIGRLKAGPERELFDRYMGRAEAAGRKLGLTFAVRESPESRAASSEARRLEEAAVLLKAATGKLVALDERGRNLTSVAFAGQLARWRDSGAGVTVAIGGADGHGAGLLERADLRLAFGEMTWPHQIVRAMLAEQLYRAVTILSGHPYHRE